MRSWGRVAVGVARASMQSAMDLEKQLDLIYQWFQNSFDNHMQCQYEKELQKKDGSEPLHDWVFSVFTAATIPKVGTHVLLAKQGFRATGQVYRKRMYSFRINAEAGRVENDIYKLKDDSTNSSRTRQLRPP